MISPMFAAVVLSSVTTAISAYQLAQPVVQQFNERSDYQGGWALQLMGSNSPSCPADASVTCSFPLLDPACCPKGQTCFKYADAGTQYCCPTEVDCSTPVITFPICANETWILYNDGRGGLFCCEPGQIAVAADWGICEPANQVVPTTLLATSTSQDIAVAAATTAATTDTAVVSGAQSGNGTVASTTSPSTAKTTKVTVATTTAASATGSQVTAASTGSSAGLSAGSSVSGRAPSTVGSISGGSGARGGLLEEGVLGAFVAVAALFV